VGETAGVAGVVAALSVVSDLARGHPPGEAMRACLLATELARRAGLDEPRRGEVYYGTLMRFAGCAATSHEIAAVFGGDDIVVRARGDLIDPAEPGEALEFLTGLGVDAARLQALGAGPGARSIRRSPACSRTHRANCWRSAARTTCGRPWSTPSPGPGARSATRRPSTKPWPGSGTPPT
jgi:hypothetical protein